MTATQAPVDSVPAAPPSTAEAPVTGLAHVLGSADHKVVGRLYVGFALLFGLASAVCGLLSGIDRIDGTYGNTILDGDTAPQVVVFHATSVPLLFLVPALLGLAMVVVPLQVGARAIAFPRAAAASLWAFVVGGGLVVTSFAINGGPGGGRSDAVDLWAAATVVVVGALVLGAICVATTVLAARTRGLDLDRVPLFAWSLMASSVVWILTLPVLAALLIVLYVDHRHGQAVLGSAGEAMVQRIAWVGRQPQVYAFAVPVLGLVLDAAATASGTRLPRRAAAQGAIGAFAVLGVGAFAVAGVAGGGADEPVTKAMAVLAPLPVLAVLGLVGLTLRQGRPRITSGLVGAVAAAVVLLLATVVGAAVPFQAALELAGTQWVTAQSHLTLVAATGALLAGLYHWATKVVGRPGHEALGRTTGALVLVGAVVLAGPEAVSGLIGEGDEAVTGIEALNVVSLVGAAVVLLGVLVAAAGLVGRRGDDPVPADPWSGQTLEWLTSSPPSFANFDDDLPVVSSPEPLLDARGTASEEGSP